MLRRDGYDVTVAEDGEQGLAEFNKNGADIVVTDLVMPKVGGMEVLRSVNAANPDVPVIIITAHGTVDSAVEAIKPGAFDYITKPFDQAELSAVIAKAAKRARRRPALGARRTAKARAAIIGESPQIQEVYKIIDKVADTPSTVLITGESGTGKELVARALHERLQPPRQAVHQDQLRRHPQGPDRVRALRLRARRLHRRRHLQARPLRARRRRHPVPRRDWRDPGRDAGEAAARAAGERVRARRRHQDHARRRAPDRRHQPRPAGGDRGRALPQGSLLPPERGAHRAARRCASAASDIPLLAGHFVEKYNRKLNKKIEGISDDAMALLQAYTWPGNIRELENLIERVLLFADGPSITAKDLPEPVRQGSRHASARSLGRSPWRPRPAREASRTSSA